MAASPPSSSTPFAWRRIAVPAYGPTLLAGAAGGAVLPVAALRAGELGADVKVAALVLALGAVGQLLGAAPAGALVARLGERRTLIAAGVVDVLAVALAGWGGRLWLMGLGLLVSGFASSAFFLARQGYMIDVLPAAQRARGMSLLGGSLRAGLLLGPAVGGVAVAWLGLRGAYLVALLCALGSLAVVALAPDLTAEHERARAAQETSSLTAVIRRHSRVLLTLGLGVVVISGLRTARLTVLPLWALHLGLDGVRSSSIFAAAGVAEIAVVYPGGWLMDRVGRAWVVAPMMALMSLSFLALPTAGSAAGLLVVAVVMAIGNGLSSGLVMTLGADAAPELDRSRFLGAWRLCGEVGNATGSVGLSAVAAAVSLPAAAIGLGLVGLAGWAWTTVWVARADRERGQAPDGRGTMAR